MAVEATATHIDRPKASESALGVGVVVLLEEVLALVEGGHHAFVFHHFRGLLEGCGGVHRGSAEQAAGIVVLSVFHSLGVAYVPRGGCCRAIVVGAGGEEKCKKYKIIK
jgi:hypothetical protein